MNDVAMYYCRRKKGWPLPGKRRWEQPAFKYLLAGKYAINWMINFPSLGSYRSSPAPTGK